jgi:phytoene dehydrogenase-like protein
MIESAPVDLQEEDHAVSTTPDRFRSLDRDYCDAVIVGAGTGGLTAAALLARRGKSVLVLDHHYVAGGNATVFRRGPYVFDVGLHYLGNCGADGNIPRILRAAGVTDVTFNEMDPDGFDTFCFPDFTFRVPKGVEALRERLMQRFPEETKGIDRYVNGLKAVWSLQGLTGGGFTNAIASLWRARHVLPHLNSTLGTFLDTCTKDVRLRAVLAGHSGDYAEPPSRASFVMHAVVTMSYVSGAYYPAGGGQIISDRLAESIEREGGKILLRAPVKRVLVEGGRTKGVEFESKHLGRRVVRAPAVISNADLKETMLELVGPGLLKPATLRKVQRYEMAPAIGVVYLGVRRDLRAEGVPNSNFWVHPSYDLEPLYAEARRGRFHPNPVCYISIATLKDPTNPRIAPPGMTNMQLATIVPSNPEAWGTTPREMTTGAYRDNQVYERAKRSLADRLIDTAETVFSGLGKDIVFQEVSSPMTHSRFTRSTGGTSYGIALTPSQSLLRRPSPATEIRGLFLCGASTISGHGIEGTMMSGLLAASQVEGVGLVRDVMSGRV